MTLVDASEVASSWRGVGTALDGIGHQIAALKATGVSFPEKVTSAMFGIGQGCTSLGAQWTTAAGDVQNQHDSVDTPKAADYKRTTAEVQQAKTATAQGLMIAAMGGSPSYAESAAANLATKRAARQQVLDTAVSETATRIQPLPGHARLAGEAVQTARGTLVTQSGGQAMPDDVQQIVPPKSGPTGNPSGGPNAKPSNNNPSPSKPSDTKPTDEKNAVDDKGAGGDPTGTKPQQGQQPSAQQSPQQGQPQGGQPQQGAGAQPAGAAPTSNAAQRAPGALPVSTPTPARLSDITGKGNSPSVRPSTPPPTPSTPAQRAGLDGRTSPLGSGTNATGAGSGANTPPSANKNGSGSGAGGGSGSSSSGTGARPMGGMMGGGHGAGGAGAQARPKGEVKADPSDKKLRGEDVAEQALGGIVKDGDTGAPIPPAAPGANGGAPTPPPPPTKP
ncbi:hypothetical protein [Tsukamurella pseudospumae]|uniref:hypothetical protein n=1 Tax=Tsukamurella pseudospumae TaxID=239498 RepID=UPI00111255D2|nr:hypothetical protein [Tsukamurella pseudospumae]